MSADVNFDQIVTSVWSAYGHRFMGGDEYADENGRNSYETCLTCGAQFILENLGDGEGRYITHSGAEPQECTYDTGMVHGYERVCQGGDGRGCEESLESDDGTCGHTNHDCNCVQCD